MDFIFNFINDICYFQAPAVAFAKKGYHILLEKPMAVSMLDKVYLRLGQYLLCRDILVDNTKNNSERKKCKMLP
jgi:hypothetical protein